MQMVHEATFQAKLNDPNLSLEKKISTIGRMVAAELNRDGVVSDMTKETIAETLINNKINTDMLDASNIKQAIVNDIYSLIKEKQAGDYIETRKEIWENALKKDEKQITYLYEPLHPETSYYLTRQIEHEIKELNTEPLTQAKIEEAVRVTNTMDNIIADTKLGTYFMSPNQNYAAYANQETRQQIKDQVEATGSSLPSIIENVKDKVSGLWQGEQKEATEEAPADETIVYNKSFTEEVKAAYQHIKDHIKEKHKAPATNDTIIIRNTTLLDDAKIVYNHVMERKVAPAITPIIKFFIPKAFIKQIVTSELSSAPAGLVHLGQEAVSISCNNPQDSTVSKDPIECYNALTNFGNENYVCRCEFADEGIAVTIDHHHTDYPA